MAEARLAPVRARLLQRCSIAALLLVVFIPVVDASSVHHNRNYHFDDCNVAGNDLGILCEAALYFHKVDSDPADGDCSGSAGSYSSCNIHHRCDLTASGSGVMTLSIYCSDVYSKSCSALSCNSVCSMGTRTACYADITGIVAVSSGSCHAFVASVDAVSLGVGSGHIYHEWSICVNGSGPYKAGEYCSWGC